MFGAMAWEASKHPHPLSHVTSSSTLADINTSQYCSEKDFDSMWPNLDGLLRVRLARCVTSFSHHLYSLHLEFMVWPYKYCCSHPESPASEGFCSSQEQKQWAKLSCSPHHIFIPALTSELNCCKLAARLYIQTPYTSKYGVITMHPLLHSVLELFGCRLDRYLTNSFSIQKSISLWQ